MSHFSTVNALYDTDVIDVLKGIGLEVIQSSDLQNSLEITNHYNDTKRQVAFYVPNKGSWQGADYETTTPLIAFARTEDGRFQPVMDGWALRSRLRCSSSEVAKQIGDLPRNIMSAWVQAKAEKLGWNVSLVDYSQIESEAEAEGEDLAFGYDSRSAYMSIEQPVMVVR